MYRFKSSITLTALAAGAESDHTITETRTSKARPGDGVVVNTRAAAEAGLSISAAWVASPGVIVVRVSNLNAAAALTAGAIDVTVTVLR